MICALAFLLASTPVRNSDLWLHLAAGRWLSAERFPDGTEPFSSTTQGVFWVNHSWLSDFFLYQLYQLGGGSALVLAKALVAALLAALLLCFRRRGEGMGISVFSALAALLALGPWLVLQPTLFSLVGVVLTLYLLERPGQLKTIAAERARARRWLLLPLFALWANLDSWFVLGPILVGLYAVGELLNEKKPLSLSSLLTPHSSLLTFLIAGLTACLATPYHFRIFAWPAPLGLTHTEQALQHDPLGQTLVLSPFGERFAATPVFRSPGAWAYYFLLAASAASFVLARLITSQSKLLTWDGSPEPSGRLRRAVPRDALSCRGYKFHGGRILVWLALAVLSIYQARAIPFFAVAAAPIVVLNIQAWWRSASGACERPGENYRRVHTSHSPGAAGLRRWAGVLVVILLLVLAWPGWLQPAPYRPRGWTVAPAESLVRLAERLQSWHAEGRFRTDRFALTFTPEAAHYLAWFCPSEKGFLDSRWPLFDRVADDYVQMRRSLLQEPGAELDKLLAKHRIDRIILHDIERDNNARAYRQLFLASPQWELMIVEGGAALFRRRHGATPAAEAFDYRRAAYYPARAQRAPVPHVPRPPSWFDAFWTDGGDHSADRAEAALHLLSFDLAYERDVQQGRLLQAAAVIASPWASGAAGTASSIAAAFATWPQAGPIEPLLTAVRAARRALACNPEDGGAFLFLGEAYFRLARQSRAGSWPQMLPALADMRQTQIVTALEQAALLRPDLDRAHELLAQLYLEKGQMDRCLDHLQSRLRIAAQNRRDAGPTSPKAALQSDVAKLLSLVEQSEKIYQANVTGKSAPSKVLERARLAARYGLTKKALQMLLESSPAIFGKEGVKYELELMLRAGQSYLVREWLEPKHETQIDFFSYHWVKARAAASCGDYNEADAELTELSESLLRVPLLPGVQAPVRSAVALHAVRAVLNRPFAAENVMEAWLPLGLLAERLRQQADRQVLCGLLALETGEVETAQKRFAAALKVWGSASAAQAGAGLDFRARPLALQMLRRLQE